MCKLENKIPKYGENCQKFEKHNIERKKEIKQAITHIINKLHKTFML
jgi:hypothetical protein